MDDIFMTIGMYAVIFVVTATIIWFIKSLWGGK